jgi:hypothetical protein
MFDAVLADMLFTLTAFALALLAVHTKRIYTDAMKEMLSERPLPRRPGAVPVRRSPSHTQ